MFEILGAKNSCRGSPWQHISIAALFDGICLRNQDIKLGGGGGCSPGGAFSPNITVIIIINACWKMLSPNTDMVQ